MSDPITRIKTPIHLEFMVSAGRAQSRFLQALTEKRILGRRCPDCTKVYVPPRGACPTCGVQTSDDEIELSDRGIVTTFCVINIPFEGQLLTPPYVSAAVILGGADVPLFHLIGGIDVNEVRMGMRVKAKWSPDDKLEPTLETINYFEPTGEPDAPFEEYQEHL